MTFLLNIIGELHVTELLESKLRDFKTKQQTQVSSTLANKDKMLTTVILLAT
jgi:hypothetical protein